MKVLGRCYYCANPLKESDKTVKVGEYPGGGVDKRVHLYVCFAAYKKYLQEVKDAMNREFKRGETQ